PETARPAPETARPLPDTVVARRHGCRAQTWLSDADMDIAHVGGGYPCPGAVGGPVNCGRRWSTEVTGAPMCVGVASRSQGRADLRDEGSSPVRLLRRPSRQSDRRDHGVAGRSTTTPSTT